MKREKLENPQIKRLRNAARNVLSCIKHGFRDGKNWSKFHQRKTSTGQQAAVIPAMDSTTAGKIYSFLYVWICNLEKYQFSFC